MWQLSMFILIKVCVWVNVIKDGFVHLCVPRQAALRVYASAGLAFAARDTREGEKMPSSHYRERNCTMRAILSKLTHMR